MFVYYLLYDLHRTKHASFQKKKTIEITSLFLSFSPKIFA